MESRVAAPLAVAVWLLMAPENSTIVRFTTTACRARSVAITPQQVAVGVDAAIAQERPDPPHVLASRHVDLGHQDLRLVLARLGEEFPLRAEHMARSPEADARSAQRRGLMAHAIAAQHRQAVGDREPAMAEDPRIALAILLRLRVVGIPADGRRIQQQFRAGERHQARTLWVPLVPAHHQPEAADR